MATKRLAVLVLSVLMLVSMAACTSSPTPAATAAVTAAPTAAPTEAATSAAAATPAPITMTCFFVTQTNDPDPTTNSETVLLEQKTGVHFDFTTVPTDGSHDKLTLLLASGDYPEVLFPSTNPLTNAELVQYGTQDKILIPLNALIDQYGVNIKARWADNPQWKGQMTCPDGNIYGIPSAESDTLGHGAAPVKLWMNMAWLQKLGLSMPTTTDEFKNVLMAFKTKDPNGNGKADEIPLTGAINTWCADTYLFLLNCFTYYDPNSLLMLKDNKFSFTANTEGFEEGLEYAAGLYKDGLIDPAAFTQNEQQMAAIGNNQDIEIGGAATCGHLAMFVDINNEARAKDYENILPLTGSNGYRGTPYSKNMNVSGAAFAITDKCQHPDRAIQVADLFCSMDWAIRNDVGIQGTEWDVADPGTFGMDGTTPAQYKYLPGQVVTSTTAVNDQWNWSCKLLEPNWKAQFEVQGDIDDPSNYEARLMKDTLKLEPYAADVQEIPPYFLNADDSNTMNQLYTALNDYVKTSIVEFITGKKNFDTDWQAYLDGLTKLNFQGYVDLNQKAYDALQK